MKNKLKKIIAIIVLLLLAVDIAGANYLVSFAVGRKTSGGAAVAPPPSTTDETQNIVNSNTKDILTDTKDWYSKQTIEAQTIQSADGLTLYADLCVTDKTSHKWAIVIHGYTSNHDAMWSYGKIFADDGFNLLMPDMRAHGKSEGDYIGMGWPDRKDVLLWIDLIISRDPQAEIVLYGISMGGATVMMTSGEDLPSNVKLTIEDCGYTSVWDIFSDEMKALFKLPDFPLLHTASVISTLRAGYNFREASSIKQLKNAKVPILFIHGGEDNFVHTDMIYKNYEACPTEKDIMVVDNAGHGQSYYYQPEAYKAKIYEFLNKYL